MVIVIGCSISAQVKSTKSTKEKTDCLTRRASLRYNNVIVFSAYDSYNNIYYLNSLRESCKTGQRVSRAHNIL